MTNGDRIRNMTDQEMAKDRVHRNNYFAEPMYYGDFYPETDDYEIALQMESEWLRSEV